VGAWQCKPGDKMEKESSTVANPKVTQLNMLKSVWSKVKPEKKENQIVTYLTRMVHNALNTSATSLLLLDDDSQELYFKFASGPSSQTINRINVGRQSGIATWVVQNGKPIVVNNAAKNADLYARMDNTTGFKTKSAIAVPLLYEGKVQGVIEALNKVDGKGFTKDDLNILIDIANISAITVESSRLNVSLMDSYRGTVQALVSLADGKEHASGGHSRRVAEYALMGARELGLSTYEKHSVEYAGLLHDIGKLSIAEEVINKPETLSPEEWKLMRQHSITGYNMLKDIPFLKNASIMILSHHERYDGSGYPHGLSGEKIPLGARLISVADAFDYMTTGHNHRAAMGGEKAFSELAKNVNTQFCPKALKAFNAGFVRSRILSNK
jgi:putative nucleotidyltransferase with HDIG domain